MAARDIIEKLKNRDESGMEELLQHYGPLMRYVIRPFLSDERDREEVLQNAALKVWQSIGRFDAEKGSWTSWLTAVARNAALDMARAEKRREAGELPKTRTIRRPPPKRPRFGKSGRKPFCARWRP